MSEYVFVTKESRKATAARRKEERVTKTQDAVRLVEALHAGVEPPPLGISLVPGEEPEERLRVPESCIGMIIGKKGERLKSIQERFKVSVTIKDGAPGEDRTVIVTGERRTGVSSAIRELDYSAEALEVPPSMSGWIVGKGGRHLKLIRDITSVGALNVRREGEERRKGGGKGGKDVPGKTEKIGAGDVAETDEGKEEADATASADETETEGRVWIEIKGQRDSVTNARICLETHMSYYPVFLEMDDVEKKLDQDITNLQAHLGRRAGTGGPRAASPGRRAASPSASGRGRGRGAGVEAEADGGSRGRGRGRGAALEPAVGSEAGSRSKGRGRQQEEGAPASSAAAVELDDSGRGGPIGIGRKPPV